MATHCPRLPPEVISHIVALAGIHACAAVRDLHALTRIFKAYKRGYFRSEQQEQAVLAVLVEHKWSAGVEASVDWDISPFANPDWQGIRLSPARIKKLWRFQYNRHYRLCLAPLVYNLLSSGNDVDQGVNELVQWCCSRSREFGIALGEELLKRGDGGLGELRALCKRTGVYIDERLLARKFLCAAAAAGNFEMVRYFDSIAPEITQQNRQMLDKAAAGGHLEIVQFVYKRWFGWNTSRVVGAAVQASHVGIATWLYDQRSDDLTDTALKYIGHHGYLDFLQTAWANDHVNFSSLHFLISEAMVCGQIKLLQWLYQAQPDCDPPDLKLETLQKLSLQTFQWAVQHKDTELSLRDLFHRVIEVGRRDLVEWMLDNKAKEVGTTWAIGVALGTGHLGLARWLAKRLDVQGELERIMSEAQQQTTEGDWIDVVPHLHPVSTPDSNQQDLLADAVADGKPAVAQLLLQRYPELVITSKMLVYLSRSSALPMIQWVYQHMDSSQRTAEAFDTAAEHGQLETVKWFHYHTDLACTIDAMEQAARTGRLDIVQFLHDNRTEGCTTAAMDNAAAAGHMDVVLWLHENRTEGCSVDAVNGAARNGLLLVVRWLHEHYPHTLTPGALYTAAEGGWLDVIRYLHYDLAIQCTTQTMDRAAQWCGLDVVRLLNGNGFETGTAVAVTAAVMMGQLATVRFLVEHGYPVDRNAIDEYRWLSDHIKEQIGPSDDGEEI
ncbi:hypothetical protein RI367_003127 [Sorochytrium milnesiophthora]